jgi:hypothetical protein
MESKNLISKEKEEKEINRDYYLKRAIIYSLITLAGPCVARAAGFVAGFLEEDPNEKGIKFVMFDSLVLLILSYFHEFNNLLHY